MSTRRIRVGGMVLVAVIVGIQLVPEDKRVLIDWSQSGDGADEPDGSEGGPDETG